MSRFGYPYGGDELRAQLARAVERAVAGERARTEEALRELERYRRAVGELRDELDAARAALAEARREGAGWRREALNARAAAASRPEPGDAERARRAEATVRELRDALERARGEAAEAQAALAEARAEAAEARGVLDEARGEAAEARAALDEARREAAEARAELAASARAQEAPAQGTSQAPQGADGDELGRLRLQQKALAQDLAAVRRRQAEELARARREERLETLAPWLAVLDDLERALAAHPDAGADDPWVQGVQAVRRRGEEALRRLGVDRLDPRGAPFDPELHEALARVPPPPGVEPGTVVDVQQVGYQTGDGELLRPAKVLVAGP